MKKNYSKTQSLRTNGPRLFKKLLRTLSFCSVFFIAQTGFSQISYNYGWEPTGLGGWVTSGNSGNFARNTTSPCTGTASVRANNYYATNSIFTSPALTGTNGGDITLQFNYKIVTYSNVGTGAALADMGTIKIEHATAAGGPWTTVSTISSTNHVVSATCATKTVVKTGVPATGDNFFRFVAQAASGADNYVYFDDIVITQGTPPTCLSPSALTISNLTPTSADLSWTENGTATEWDIEYGLAGFTPTGTPTQAGLTTNQALLTSLNPSTEYDFYVRAVCSTTDASTWTGPYSFITLCAPITALPWTENFDFMTTVDTDIFPPCWVAETTDEWGTGNYPADPPYDAGPLSGSNYLYASYYSDSKVWTPEFELVAGETYEFSFNWAGDGGSGWEGAVYVNGSQTTSGSTMLGTKFVEFGDETTINYQKEIYCFTPTTSGVYTFGVHVEEVDYEYYLNFDDFELKQVVTTPGVDGSLSTCQIGSPVDLNTVITTTVTDGTWTFDINPNAVNVNMFNTTNLASGTYDVLYVVGGCIPDTTVATITVVQPSSAGGDGSLAVCRNQPFNLLSGLVGSADLGGVWTDPNAVVVPSGDVTASNIPGQYNFKYIVSNGVCPADTAKVIVNVQGCNYIDIDLGVEDVAFEGFNLYPNPTTDLIYITNSGSSNVFNYEVLDMNGRVILKANDAINGTATTEINLNQVEVGVYMVRVFNKNADKTFRVVKN